MTPDHCIHAHTHQFGGFSTNPLEVLPSKTATGGIGLPFGVGGVYYHPEGSQIPQSSPGYAGCPIPMGAIFFSPLALASVTGSTSIIGDEKKVWRESQERILSLETRRCHGSCRATRKQKRGHSPEARSARARELIKLWKELRPLCAYVFPSCFVTHCQERRYQASGTLAFNSCFYTSLSHN